MNDIYRSITKNISAREEKLFPLNFYFFYFLFSKFAGLPIFIKFYSLSVS